VAANILELNGSAVSIGPTESNPAPVALALPLVAILQSIGACLASLSAAIAATAAPDPLTGQPVPGATAATSVGLPIALSAAEAAISSALLEIATETAIG
jgi:hypothetical protein